VSYETDIKAIIHLLTDKDKWNIKKPELIISVTGGANDLDISHKLKETFCKGLLKAAITTSIKLIYCIFILKLYELCLIPRLNLAILMR